MNTENRQGILEKVGSFLEDSGKREKVRRWLVLQKLQSHLSQAVVPGSGGRLVPIEKGSAINDTKKALKLAIESGIDGTHGEDIALGVSIVRAHMTRSAWVVFIAMPTFVRNPDAELDAMHGRVINATAEWLSTRKGLRGIGGVRSKEETARLLREVDEKWKLHSKIS